MRRKFWTLDPRLRRLERALKILSAAFGLAGVGALLCGGLSLPVSFALVGFVMVALFETLSLITGHRRPFTPVVFWLALFTGTAIVFRAEWWAIVASICGAIGTVVIARAFRRWKAEVLEAGRLNPRSYPDPSRS